MGSSGWAKKNGRTREWRSSAWSWIWFPWMPCVDPFRGMLKHFHHGEWCHLSSFNQGSGWWLALRMWSVSSTQWGFLVVGSSSSLSTRLSRMTCYLPLWKVKGSTSLLLYCQWGSWIASAWPNMCTATWWPGHGVISLRRRGNTTPLSKNFAKTGVLRWAVEHGGFTWITMTFLKRSRPLPLPS